MSPMPRLPCVLGEASGKLVGRRGPRDQQVLSRRKWAGPGWRTSRGAAAGGGVVWGLGMVWVPLHTWSNIPAWLRVGGTPEGTGRFTGKARGVPLSLGPRSLQGPEGRGFCPLGPPVSSRALSTL